MSPAMTPRRMIISSTITDEATPWSTSSMANAASTAAAAGAGGADQAVGAAQRRGDEANHGGADDAGDGAVGGIGQADGGIDGDAEKASRPAARRASPPVRPKSRAPGCRSAGQARALRLLCHVSPSRPHDGDPCGHSACRTAGVGKAKPPLQPLPAALRQGDLVARPVGHGPFVQQARAGRIQAGAATTGSGR